MARRGGCTTGGERIPRGPNPMKMASSSVDVAGNVERIPDHPASDRMRCPGRIRESMIIDGTGLIHATVNWCHRTLQIDARAMDRRHWHRSYTSSGAGDLPMAPCRIHRVLGWLIR